MQTKHVKIVIKGSKSAQNAIQRSDKMLIQNCAYYQLRDRLKVKCSQFVTSTQLFTFTFFVNFSSFL